MILSVLQLDHEFASRLNVKIRSGIYREPRKERLEFDGLLSLDRRKLGTICPEFHSCEVSPQNRRVIQLIRVKYEQL